MILNLVVAVQTVTFGTLTVLFWRTGQPTLAIAQACYMIATVALFGGKA